jgi:hypothetical protein
VQETRDPMTTPAAAKPLLRQRDGELATEIIGPQAATELPA